MMINIARGLLGLAFMVGICYVLSSNRRAINWRLVGSGLLFQLLLAIVVLQIPFFKVFFDTISQFFVLVLDFSKKGAEFVLGAWPDRVFVLTDPDPAAGKMVDLGYIIAFKVLPAIIFFSALASVLYYFGILQVVIKGFAWVMSKTMKMTGAESLAAAANVFIGQTEAPLAIKPYLEKMSRSEILCLMTGGMATIAGSVFAAYVGFLGGEDPVARQQFATHLLVASLMSAPAAIVASKMILPETEKMDEGDQKLNIPRQEVGNNLLDAITRGSTDGLRLAVNVGVMLLVFTALIAMLNHIISHSFGTWFHLNEYVQSSTGGVFKAFNLEYILGILFAPVAWLLGVASQDVLMVGQLLGLKTTLNEFFAYAALQDLKLGMQPRSVIISTYALCGFANFASIGIQIGGISAIAPGQRKNLTELGMKALIAGSIACFMTATIAGMLIK